MASEIFSSREGRVNPINAQRRSIREADKDRVQRSVLNELSIVSSRYTNPKAVSVEITPKGNYRIWYGDNDTGLTVGRINGVSLKDLRKHGLLKTF